MTWLDPIRDRLGLHPLLDWTNKEVYYYMTSNDLPQHPLFEQGIRLSVIGIRVDPMMVICLDAILVLVVSNRNAASTLATPLEKG